LLNRITEERRLAKGQHLSSYQKGIVNRYYEHHDTILITRLSEIVSELYLAEGKAAEKHWARAEKALAASKMQPAKFEGILKKRDVVKLAELVAGMDKQSR
jgi:hypothetical protein